VILLLAAALGLTLGASRSQVIRTMEVAGISCRAGSGRVLECVRAPEEVPGADGLRLEFDKSGLTRAVLSIEAGAPTYAAFHARYQEMKRWLSTRHGEPKTSLEYVERSYVLADDQYQGIADRKGEYTSTWKTPELDLKLSLYGEKGKVRLALSCERQRGAPH